MFVSFFDLVRPKPFSSVDQLQNVRVKVLPNVTVSDEKMLSTFLRVRRFTLIDDRREYSSS